MKQICWTLYRKDGTVYHGNGSRLFDNLAKAWLEYIQKEPSTEMISYRLK